MSRREAEESGFLELGIHSYGQPVIHVFRGDTAQVRIGRFCSIASNVEFYVGGNHRTDWVTTYPFRIKFGLPSAGEDGHPATRGDIEVGHDTWLGAGATILSGVTIGHGAVVGARAVVTSDVDPYGIAVGNPARVVSHRFSENQIASLLDIAWWDWPLELILSRVDSLCSDQVDMFISRYTPT